jgi:AraC family transcriptional regulator
MIGLMLPPAINRYEKGRAMLLAGLRQHHSFADCPSTIAQQWQALTPDLPLADQIATTSYGAICGTDMEQQSFEYLAGVEVSGFDALPAHMGRMRVPSADYAVFIHDGHISDLQDLWRAIWSLWVPSADVTLANTPDFERYDARFNPGTGLGKVEIWIPVIL